MKEEKQKRGEELTEEEKSYDFGRQLRPREMNIYPNSLGLTGKAFHSGKVIRSNNVAQNHTYLPSIDNISDNVKTCHSLMIVPVFGHR